MFFNYQEYLKKQPRYLQIKDIKAAQVLAAPKESIDLSIFFEVLMKEGDLVETNRICRDFQDAAIFTSYRPKYTVPSFSVYRADSYAGVELEEWFSKIAQHFRPIESERVSLLDIGAGVGVHVEAIANRIPNANFIALEPCEHLAAISASKFESISIKMNEPYYNEVCSQPFEVFVQRQELKFDLVLANFCFLFTAQPVGNLFRAIELLNKGGLIVVQDFLSPIRHCPIERAANSELLIAIRKTSSRPFFEEFLKQIGELADAEIVHLDCSLSFEFRSYDTERKKTYLKAAKNLQSTLQLDCNVDCLMPKSFFMILRKK